MELKKENLPKLMFNISILIFLTFAFIFLMSSFGFIFKLPINIFYPILSILLSSLLVGFKAVKKDKLSILETVLMYVFALILTKFFSWQALGHWDSSYDGRSYHQSGIIALSLGWNPIYQGIEEFVKIFPYKILDLIWCENYPKFSEIIASNIYKLTGEIEIAKTLNLLSAAGLFFYIYFILDKYLLQKNKPLTKLFISFLFIYNPVFLSQMFTFYVDGLIYIYFMVFVFSIIAIDFEEKITPESAFLIVFSSVAMMNIKFSGLIYFIFLSLFCLLFLCIKKKSCFKNFLKCAVIAALLGSITLINPYFKNAFEGKTPFYPLTGKDKIDVMAHNTPEQFKNKNMVYRFLYSTFARSANFEKKLELKVPMSITKTELYKFELPDTRVAGFGVFFGGALLLSLLQLFFVRPKKNQTLILILLALCVLFNPQNWWARYVPWFWAFVVFVNLFSVASGKRIKYLSFFVLFIMFINSLIVHLISLRYCVYYSVYSRVQLSQIAPLNSKKELLLYTKGLHELRFPILLDRCKIKYRFISDEEYQKNKAQMKNTPLMLEEGELEWNY